MQRSAPTSRWLEPSTLLGLAGFLALVWTGYQQFQRDTTADVFRLSERVAVLETQVAFLLREKAR